MWLLFDKIQIEALFGPTKLMMFSTQSSQPRLSLVQSLLGLHSGIMEGMFRLYFWSVMGLDYLCGFWKQRFLVWQGVINVLNSFYHKDFLSILVTQGKWVSDNIFVLIFWKFSSGKWKTIKVTIKRNILCYCLFMFCKDSMLFVAMSRSHKLITLTSNITHKIV